MGLGKERSGGCAKGGSLLLKQHTAVKAVTHVLQSNECIASGTLEYHCFSRSPSESVVRSFFRHTDQACQVRYDTIWGERLIQPCLLRTSLWYLPKTSPTSPILPLLQLFAQLGSNE